MKFLLEVNNKTTQKVDKKTLLSVFRYTLEIAKLDCLAGKKLQLSVALVETDQMHVLNKQYRSKDKSTDVLSFYEYGSQAELCADGAAEIFLGELILCPEYIAKGAQEDGETFEYALNYITSHGILHLLGFAHGAKMFNMQRLVADKINNEKIC
jgi:probable rRNA maturation factor